MITNYSLKKYLTFTDKSFLAGIRCWSFYLHMFVGVGALFGGWLAFAYPKGGVMGLSVDILKHSPFTSFLVPGIILFFLIGLGNIFSALSMGFGFKYQGYISSVFGWALVIWILVQCIMLRGVVFIHVIFFLIGVIQGVFAFFMLIHEKLFPANIALSIIEKFEARFPQSLISQFIAKLKKLLEVV